MSTHGCFAPLFPLASIFRLMQPDGGPQELDATPVDYYYPRGAYYYVEPADDQE